MDLFERLRPKWRHPDPAVRAVAVRDMGSSDQERLVTIARTDTDATVRRAAVKRVDDPAVLESIAAAEPDQTVREYARARAADRWLAVARSDAALDVCTVALAGIADEHALVAAAGTAVHAEIRQAALARLTTDRALRDVARDADDPALRRAAVVRIADPTVLRGLAVASEPADVALLALERIADREILRAIAEHRSAPKAVRQRARELLPAGTTSLRPVGLKDIRARQLALCTTVEALRHAHDDALRVAEQVQAAAGEWDELATGTPPLDDVRRRFEIARDAILTDAASVARIRADVDHDRAVVQEGLTARRALCAEVDALDAAVAKQRVGDARRAWERLPALASHEAGALGRRFQEACERALGRHATWTAQQDRVTLFDGLVDDALRLAEADPVPAPPQWHALERRWTAAARAHEAASDLAEWQRRFAQAGTRLRERWEDAQQQRTAAQQANLEHLTTLVARADAILAADAAKPGVMRRELETLDAAIADLGPLPGTERRAVWTDRLTELRTQVLRRLREGEEAEGWRRWANVGAQEAIIARVEALLESGDLAEGTRQLGRLQTEWGTVATATPDKSQALWDRFRTVRNELQRRCDAYMAENLEKKRALCQKVEAVGESTSWNDTAELVRRAQAEWKAIGPVPGKHAQAIWQQFREPCDRFFARRKEHFGRIDTERSENARRKGNLCERAEALVDSTEWDATAEAFKRLQAEWKQTGPPPQAEAEALWQRFRSACDRFFDRRNRRHELERDAVRQKGIAVCDTLEALVAVVEGDEPPTPDEIGRQVDAAWAEWVHLALPAADGARELRERIFAACTRIAARVPACLHGTRLDPAVTRKRREKLVTRLEGLVDGPRTPEVSGSLQAMALALRDRLATNTIAGGGAAARPGDVAEDVARIGVSWANTGPAFDDEARTLAERYERALGRLGGRRGST